MGGLQSSLPESDHALAIRLALHSAGGPIANLVTAAAVWAVLGSVDAPTTVPGAVVRDASMVVGVVSAAGGIWNLIPHRSRRGALSDGGRIVEVLRWRAKAPRSRR